MILLYRPVMQEMQRRCYPQNFPGFDGRKNLYSKGRLPFGAEVSNMYLKLIYI